MRRTSRLLVMAGAAVAALAVGACAADGGGGTATGSSAPGTTRPVGGVVMTTTPASELVTADSLVGATFRSTAVTGRELAPGTAITLAFTDADLRISAGCNTFGGAYTLDGAQLRTAAMAGTEIACPEPIAAQDGWLTRWLAQPLQIAATSEGIRLSGGGVTIELAREVVPPAPGTSPADLVGRTWTVHSVEAGDAVSSVPADRAPSFAFAADGTVAVFTGCNRGTTTYRAGDDGRIEFGEAIATPEPCPDPTTDLIEVAIVGQLGNPGATWRLDGGDLVLANAQGALVASPG